MLRTFFLPQKSAKDFSQELEDQRKSERNALEVEIRKGNRGFQKMLS